MLPIALYNIRHIRKFLSKESTETLIYAFITSRLYYCSNLFYGLLNSPIFKLQRIQNARARSLPSVPTFCHVTSIVVVVVAVAVAVAAAAEVAAAAAAAVVVVFKANKTLHRVLVLNLVEIL